MLRRILYQILAFSVICSCHLDDTVGVTKYQYSIPDYDQIALIPTRDTLHLQTNDATLDRISLPSYFLHGGKELMAIVETEKLFINFYMFRTSALVQKLDLRKLLPNLKPKLTSVYVKNLDSIFLTSQLDSLYMLNNRGQVIKRVKIYKSNKSLCDVFSNHRPLIIKDSIIYTGVLPNYDVTHATGLNTWKIMYGFNLKNNDLKKAYNMPQRYHNRRYDYHFYNYSYCLNSRGNFVYSFPADTCIYETDLFSNNVSYNCKSKFQKEDIPGVSDEQLSVKGGSSKQFRIRDSYGPLFYDRFTRRYLRLFLQKLPKDAFERGIHNRERKRSVLVLDDSFKIIGESSIPNLIHFNSLFITVKGEIFLRTNQEKQNLTFVRLDYSDRSFASLPKP